MRAISVLTRQRLHAILSYDPETGEFRWRVANSRRAPADSVAGGIDRVTGYRRIRLDGRLYQAHRLAWFYVTGEWPANTVDHINGAKDDQRWCNLRDVEHRTNCENQRRARRDNRSSGLLGSSWDRSRDRWMSHITVDGRRKTLGYFDSAAQAHDRYLEAKRQLHAGCTL